jgi:hypothetical protein
MSSFFTFGLNMRSGSGGPGFTIPAEGCPLENHPRWRLVHGAVPSNMCWSSEDGRSIRGVVGNNNFANLAYANQFFQDGMISAIVAKVVTTNGNYVLPIAGRMIDFNNFLGARTATGKYEVIDKVGGTFHTLFSGGTPVVGDKMTLSILNQSWVLSINDVVLASGNTNLMVAPGYWGCSSHRVTDGDPLITDLNIVEVTAARTPCMTSSTDPYGVVEASSIFGPNYAAWKGMNCTTNGSTDTWISYAEDPMPQWIRWVAPPGSTAMVPFKLTVVGRSINASHNRDHGPETMTLIGTLNGVDWIDIQTWSGLDFGAQRTQIFGVTSDQAFVGIGIRVDNVRATSPPNTQIGTFTVEGFERDNDEMTLEFNIAADGETLTLPINAIASGYSPDFEVYWDDGTDWEPFTTDYPAHTYTTAGTYLVSLKGKVTSWSFSDTGDKNKIIKVMNLGKCEWKNLVGAFHGCANLASFVAGINDISGCTSLENFIGSSNCTYTNLLGLDTSRVTEFRNWLYGHKFQDQHFGIDEIDTSSAISLYGLFNTVTNVTKPLDVSNYDTDTVTSIIRTANNTGSNSGLVDPIIGLDNWNVSSVTVATDFAKRTTFSTPYYDSILTAWGPQAVQSGVVIHFGNSKYSSEGEDGRNLLLAKGWTIIDQGYRGIYLTHDGDPVTYNGEQVYA